VSLPEKLLEELDKKVALLKELGGKQVKKLK
jgi:metal-responsive CopG/Arc/MetJ family transcriptional regulator